MPQDFTTEIWKPIPGYESSYEVSNHGNVRSFVCKHLKKPRIMRPTCRRGYMEIGMVRNGIKTIKSVHSLVLLAFAGEIPTGLECNHKNGNKSDNRLENLEHCTRSQNQLHAIHILGTSVPRKGSKHWNAKFTETRIIELRKIFAQRTISVTKLAQKLGINRSTLWEIGTGHRWRHI